MRGTLYLVPIGFIGFALVGSLLVPARPVGAQDKGADPTQEIHLGAGSCAAHACHGGNEDRREHDVWATRDKHHQAYDVLSNPLGKRIGQRLGIDPTADESCLACHATTGVRLAKTHVIEDGVSCELCHGGAKRWLGPHATPEWQTWSKVAKEKVGFRDLTTPKTRVAVCMRCHVGGKDSDITHEIMAAGHPPLMFDAGAYLRKMPPHWKDPEKDRAARTVQTWVAGLKAAALAQLDRIARVARKGDLEFGLFDCFSCHHAIYSGSVYEQQAPPGRPGDLALDLSALRVLAIADPRIQLDPALTFAPKGDVAGLAPRARALAQSVAKVESLHGDADRYLKNIDGFLQQVEAKKARASRAEMQLLALAIQALRDENADEALDRALRLGTPFDAAQCARLARAVLAR